MRIWIETGPYIHDGVWAVLPAAVEYDDSILVSTLLEKAVKVNIRYPSGRTACHVATYLYNLDMVKLLLDGGADASTKHKRGGTARNILEYRLSEKKKENRDPETWRRS